MLLAVLVKTECLRALSILQVPIYAKIKRLESNGKPLQEVARYSFYIPFMRATYAFTQVSFSLLYVMSTTFLKVCTLLFFPFFVMYISRCEVEYNEAQELIVGKFKVLTSRGSFFSQIRKKWLCHLQISVILTIALDNNHICWNNVHFLSTLLFSWHHFISFSICNLINRLLRLKIVILTFSVMWAAGLRSATVEWSDSESGHRAFNPIETTG